MLRACLRYRSIALSMRQPNAVDGGNLPFKKCSGDCLVLYESDCGDSMTQPSAQIPMSSAKLVGYPALPTLQVCSRKNAKKCSNRVCIHNCKAGVRDGCSRLYRCTCRTSTSSAMPLALGGLHMGSLDSGVRGSQHGWAPEAEVGEGAAMGSERVEGAPEVSSVLYDQDDWRDDRDWFDGPEAVSAALFRWMAGLPKLGG